MICVLTAGPVEDPFPDPPDLEVPAEPPVHPPDTDSDMVRIAEDEDPLITLPEEETEQQRRRREAAAAALTLEMVGDLPFANVRPPENVLFVCKLNPVTTDDALELLFSRFGKIMSCQVIRDKRTGDSLQYAFIEFDKREDAEQVCCLYSQMASYLYINYRHTSKCRTSLSMTVAFGWICESSSSPPMALYLIHAHYLQLAIRLTPEQWTMVQQCKDGPQQEASKTSRRHGRLWRKERPGSYSKI